MIVVLQILSSRVGSVDGVGKINWHRVRTLFRSHNAGESHVIIEKMVHRVVYRPCLYIYIYVCIY
jgi:hypothetical protein